MFLLHTSNFIHIALATPVWPCLNSALNFRLLSEKQFYTLHRDDTVTATVALASLSMLGQTCLPEEKEEEEEEGDGSYNRKRALSASVTGGAAALLKVK